MTLAGLIRAAGAIDGLERLRLSSIEVNHVTPDLIAAMRETPVVSRHLHVPLQSGDDDVLRAMGRRYTIGQYRARIEPLEDFNLTTDVIVGFPTEDERAFAQYDGGGGGNRHHQGARLSRTRPGRERAPLPTIPSRGTSRRTAARGSARRRTRRAGRAGRTGWGAGTSSSSTARGSATPTTTRHGSSTRRSARSCRPRRSASPTRGCWPLSQPDCLFCHLVANGDHVHAADGFVAIRDISPGGRDAPARPARAAHRHVPPDRRVPGRGSRPDAAIRGRRRGRRRARRLPRDRQRRASRRADGVPPPLARVGRKSATRVPLSAN